MGEIVSYRGCSLPSGLVLCPSSERRRQGWPHREQARSHMGSVVNKEFVFTEALLWERACSR
ncbi:hypothetical protein C1C98_08855 [Pseudomonas ogarae]|uniref:Uncharacterized protein n=1 Tax=Pseudomonas ogarae (strain DSM 112162 / CECT 30235 / F113) TaxID=1114970 RepID=A0ABM6QWX4_PSEO1|nr:hypothetical protein C1C98_08855 [Pseudomonas ogarae]